MVPSDALKSPWGSGELVEVKKLVFSLHTMAYIIRGKKQWSSKKRHLSPPSPSWQTLVEVVEMPPKTQQNQRTLVKRK